MTMLSIGDLARSLMLQRASVSARADIDRLSAEVASGQARDPAAALGGNLQPLAAIEAVQGRIAAWQTAARSVGAQLGSLQTALGALEGIAQAQTQALLQAGQSGIGPETTRAAADAFAHLEAMIGIINARAGGESVLAGVRGDGPAVAGADALIAALQPVVAGAASPAAAAAAVAAWFDDPSGFAAQVYQGGAQRPPVTVAAGEEVSLPATADHPALRGMLSGLAMAALVDRGLFVGDPAAQRSMLKAAGETLLSNGDARTALAAATGAALGRIDRIMTRHAAEDTALGLARADLIGLDPFATASELEAARVRLETLYTLTARLSGLGLAGWLR